jgi:hypothetical protein
MITEATETPGQDIEPRHRVLSNLHEELSLMLKMFQLPSASVLEAGTGEMARQSC